MICFYQNTNYLHSLQYGASAKEIIQKNHPFEGERTCFNSGIVTGNPDCYDVRKQR